MEVFGITPSSVTPVIYTDTLVVGHGFVFVQVKHPTVFEWDKESSALHSTFGDE